MPAIGGAFGVGLALPTEQLAYLGGTQVGLRPGIGLFALDVRGGQTVPLFAEPGMDIGGISWLGDTIAYTRTNGTTRDIRALNVRTGETSPLIEHLDDDYNPAFSPNGERLVFVSLRTNVPQIYEADLTTGETRRITSGGGPSINPAYAPDGERIAYAGGDVGLTLWVTTGDVATPLVSSQPFVRSVAPAWSPDGAQVAYISDVDNGWGVYTVDVGSQRIRRVAGVFPNAVEVSYSPGGRLAFIQSRRSGWRVCTVERCLTPPHVQTITFAWKYN